MRDLDLFERYLVRYRRDRLQLSHGTLVNSADADWAQRARTYACQAEAAERIREALRKLIADPGKFEKEYLT